MLCSDCPHCEPRAAGEHECAWTGAQVHPADALAPAGLDNDDRHICPLTLDPTRRVQGVNLYALTGGVLRRVVQWGEAQGREGLLDDLLATYKRDGEAARLYDCWQAAEEAEAGRAPKREEVACVDGATPPQLALVDADAANDTGGNMT